MEVTVVVEKAVVELRVEVAMVVVVKEVGGTQLSFSHICPHLALDRSIDHSSMGHFFAWQMSHMATLRRRDRFHHKHQFVWYDQPDRHR